MDADCRWGDIIAAFDGQSVTRMEGLQKLLQMAHPGQEVTLTVLRNAERVQVAVVLGKRSARMP